MEKFILKLTAFALLWGVAGCFSLQTASLNEAAGEGLRLHASSEMPPVAHTVVSNDGWYLFNLWPLASGNATEGARMPFRLFRNDVQEDILHGRLTKYAQSQGCDVADLVLLSNEQVLLSIPGLNFPLPIPYIFTSRRIQLSAVLVKHAEVSTIETDAARRRAMSREMKLLLNEIPNGGDTK